MDINTRALDAFVQACDEMAASKFIMSDKYISQVLKTIAAFPRLYEILAYCVTNFDFALEFDSAIVSTGDGRSAVNYPTSKEKFLAFVFFMLWEIDAGRLNLTRFLQECYMYNMPSLNDAYRAWCNDVILKFKRTAVAMLSINDNELYFEDGDDQPLNIRQIEEISTAISELIIFLSKEKMLSLTVREEIYTLAHLLNSSLRGRRKLIFGLFTGLKYAAQPYKFLNNYIENIARLLQAYGILD